GHPVGNHGCTRMNTDGWTQGDGTASRLPIEPIDTGENLPDDNRSSVRFISAPGSARREDTWMQRDTRGLALSTDSAEAVAAFDLAVEHYLKYHADTMALVADALTADPGFVMGHCIKGYLMLAGANPAHRPIVAASLAAARAGAAVATPREQRHVAALDALL